MTQETPSTEIQEWEEQRELFRLARGLPQSTRSRLLERECAGRPALRAAVEELLAADESTSPVLDQPWIGRLILGAASEGHSRRPHATRIEPLSPGTLLGGRFEVLRLIGSGGMGVVYAVWDRVLGTEVALKLLRESAVADASLMQRVTREVNLSRRVTHPNVCRTYELFESDGQVFIAMELLEGESLAERLARGPVAEGDARQIASAIAEALSAAHASGIVHRDLKPANVMLTGDPDSRRVVVTDFGLAINSSPNSEPITRSGQILGTLAYMAPEQLEGKPATPSTDVYALGLIMHQMLTGKLPYSSETPVSMALERLRRPASSPDLASLDLWWRRMILRCLERRADDRFASGVELAKALQAGSPVSMLPSERRRLGLTAIATVALLGVIGLANSVLTRTETGPPTVPERRWVMVGPFENRSGDPLLDGSIEYALERELSESPRFSVVPRERVNDLLLLMKKDPATRLDRALARELALRDGEVDVIITGRIQRLGSSLVLHTEMLDPNDGRPISSASEEASSNAEILPAVRRLASRLRATLGEEIDSVRASEERLARVTTPSLRALQLYSRADAVIGTRDNAAAARLLEEAIAADPTFASAQMHLAFALRNLGRPASDYMPHAQRAFELSTEATERERLFIRGSYFRMQGEFDEAATSYRALLEIDADHFWAVNNLANLLSLYTPRHEEAVAYAVRGSRLRPKDLSTTQRAAEALAIWANDPGAARPFVESGRQLIEVGTVQPPSIAAWLLIYPAHEAWTRGDHGEAERQLEARIAELDTLPSAVRDSCSELIGRIYLVLGEADAAERLFEKISVPEWRNGLRLEVARIEGDEDALLSGLRSRATARHRGMAVTAIELARRGRSHEANMLLQWLREIQHNDVDQRETITSLIDAVEGELLLSAGKTEEAFPKLEATVRRLRPTGLPEYFLASQALAGIWIDRGDLPRARAILQDAVRQKGRSFPRAQTHWKLVADQLSALDTSS